MTLPARKPCSADASTTSRFSVPPTARMHDWGGFMMAVKFRTPNIPRFEMEKVPPYLTKFGLNSYLLIKSIFDLLPEIRGAEVFHRELCQLMCVHQH
jgi:hypothetical protein